MGKLEAKTPYVRSCMDTSYIKNTHKNSNESMLSWLLLKNVFELDAEPSIPILKGL